MKMQVAEAIGVLSVMDCRLHDTIDISLQRGQHRGIST